MPIFIKVQLNAKRILQQKKKKKKEKFTTQGHDARPGVTDKLLLTDLAP